MPDSSKTTLDTEAETVLPDDATNKQDILMACVFDDGYSKGRADTMQYVLMLVFTGAVTVLVAREMYAGK